MAKEEPVSYADIKRKKRLRRSSYKGPQGEQACWMGGGGGTPKSQCGHLIMDKDGIGTR